MFTGIIEAVGSIARSSPSGGGRILSIGVPFASELKIDQSVAVNGACLTVIAKTNHTFDVLAVEETLSKTALRTMRQGDPVNLERAVQLGSRLDGHLVQGHVDTVGEVIGVEVRTSSRLFRIRFEEHFSRYVIPTGSIALDGISLTTASVGDGEVTVSIIPYTFENTNIAAWKAGSSVNIEFDMIGKYVLRAVQAGNSVRNDLTPESLREKGF